MRCGKLVRVHLCVSLFCPIGEDRIQSVTVSIAEVVVTVVPFVLQCGHLTGDVAFCASVEIRSVPLGNPHLLCLATGTNRFAYMGSGYVNQDTSGGETWILIAICTPYGYGLSEYL